MSSWKDNSHVVTASITAAASLLFAIGVYEQSMIPTRTSALNNEINEKNKELNEKTKRISTLDKRILEAEQKISSLEQKLTKANNSLTETLDLGTIQHNNPYPRGLGKLRIGDSADLALEIFHKEKVDTSQSSYYSVDVDGFISGATYYFDEEDETKKITHILIHAQPKFDIENYKSQNVDDDRLQPVLEEALGQYIKLPKEGYYLWALDTVNVFKEDNRSYLIMEKGFIPGTWPKKLMSFLHNSNSCTVPTEAAK